MFTESFPTGFNKRDRSRTKRPTDNIGRDIVTAVSVDIISSQLIIHTTLGYFQKSVLEKNQIQNQSQ